MKKLILFDVDGTLTESGKIIEDDMLCQLNKIKEKGFDIGIVGGGKLEKILTQIKNCYYIDHFFTECGCVYYKNIGNDTLILENIYTKNIRKHELYPKINILIKEALLFLSQVDYVLTGNFIDLRNGIIYISLIGMVATDVERKYFIEINKQYKYRTRLIEILKKKAEELNILNQLSICQGGEVGIGIYPREYDKIQVIEHISEYSEIHYFGDKYEIDGNDYNIINYKNIIGHPVDNYEQTLNILDKIVKSI
jgi:phosphomannomutase